MQFIIEATIKTLHKTSVLLSKLSDRHLSDTSIPPYFSSIGSHIRHILDFYDCIFTQKDRIVDLTSRKRDENIESNCNAALEYLESTILKLENFKQKEDTELTVKDDLGTGEIIIKYTLSALFAQANSHTIHHYAIINYILNGLNLPMTDDTFGYNPTTPRNFSLDE